ncbi:hypothetical protein J6590_045066 [Homalodisca vitripennis]|nr:hypothetical protein J6590_045066 [Homalodisca vitripennis]
MWSELTGGRGSEQIASCIFKKIIDLPDSVKQIVTYSDTFGGQNRNINIAVMFMYAVAKKDTLKYDLNPFSPFRKLNLIRDRKGRKVIEAAGLTIPNCYSKTLGINLKKKKDLLSILDQIDKECQPFYRNLPTNSQAREFDELDDEDSKVNSTLATNKG